MTPPPQTPGVTVAAARAVLGDDVADRVTARAAQVPPMSPLLRRQIVAVLTASRPVGTYQVA